MPTQTLNFDKLSSPAEALCELVRYNVNIARQNEIGIIADSNIEHLHEYRVCLRRIRAAIQLFKSHFNTPVIQELKLGFSGLMQPTGTLRDLDVALADKQSFIRFVPNTQPKHLAGFFKDLARRRKAAYKSLKKHLKTSVYRQHLDEMTDLLDDLLVFEQAQSDTMNCQMLVKQRIEFEFGKACRRAQRIDQGHSDKNLHALRIQCKRLRYSMELFAPLLCEQAKKALVKKLKSLQEEMGAYNDRCMQLQMLRDFEATEGADKKAKKAVKLLIQSIKRAQLEARKSIERSSNAFFGEKTQQLLHLITQ